MSATGNSTFNNISSRGIGSFNTLSASGDSAFNNVSARGNSTFNTLTATGLTVSGNVKFGRYAEFDPNAQLCMKDTSNSNVCLTSADIAKLRALPNPTPVVTPVVVKSSRGLKITHPNGKQLRMDGSSIRLNSGTPITVDLFKDPTVYKSPEYLGLFVGGRRDTAMRHHGYIVYANPFQQRNFDFAWKLIPVNNGYQIFNEFEGSYLLYNDQTDSVLIGRASGANIVTWNITPVPDI